MERYRLLIRAVFAFASALAYPICGAETDICDQKVPSSLKRVLAEKYPGFRPGLMNDQDPDATRDNQKRGGDGCLTVSIGDFDGNGIKDVAVLMTRGVSNRKTDTVRLVIALQRPGTWALYPLKTWCATIDSCYVQTERPGLYNRAETLDGPVSEPGERTTLRSRNDVVLSGTLEAVAIVYAYSSGKWIHVWLSN
jgi:hypothetical protein